MFSAADLAAMRETQESALPDTGYIKTVTLTGDGQGGYTAAYGAPVAVSCRLAPALSHDERILAERLGVQSLWRITFPAGTAVANTCVIVIGSAEYEVVSETIAHSWETAKQVLCTRIA